MNKKTTTVVIIVVAVVIVGAGAFYGFNRWRQQRLVAKYFQELYGTAAPTVGGLLGGGQGLSADTINELAKLQAEADAKADAEEAAREAAEAAKTPEQKFDETEAAYVTSDVASMFDDVAKSDVKAVFGDYKVTSSTIGYFGERGFVVQLKVPEVVTPEKFNELVDRFLDQGYQSVYGEITADTGSVMMQKGEDTTLSLSFDGSDDGQGLMVMYTVNE